MTATRTKQPNKNTLRRLLRQWKNGEVSKEAAEAQLGVHGAHGKFVTRQWFSRLGVDTRGGRNNIVDISKVSASQARETHKVIIGS